jgi:CBP4
MYYVTPSEAELFNRFSPELQAFNLANRDRRQREYEDFVGKLKEYSKSDKPIWEAAAEAQRKQKEAAGMRDVAGRREEVERLELERLEAEKRRVDIRREAFGR